MTRVYLIPDEGCIITENSIRKSFFDISDLRSIEEHTDGTSTDFVLIFGSGAVIKLDYNADVAQLRQRLEELRPDLEIHLLRVSRGSP